MASQNSLLAVLATLTMVLAGCAGTEDGGIPQEAGTLEAPPPPAADEGQIAGFVTDDEQAPLALVEVALIDTLYDTQYTDSHGNFYFAGLSPGTYSIGFLKLGYESAARSVTVGGGEVASVNIELRPIYIAKDPRYEVLLGRGYIACGAYLVVVTVSNLNACAWDTNHMPRFEFDAGRTALMGVMQEVYWEKSTAATGDRLFVYLWYKPVCDPTCNGDREYEETLGPSPVRQYSDLEDESYDEDPVPFASMTFVGGSGAEPVVVYSQSIDHYITNWYNQHGDLDTFTAIPDF